MKETKLTLEQEQLSAVDPVPVSWRALQIFTFYRLCLVVGLIVIYHVERSVETIGQQDPQLYITYCCIYLLFALIWIGAGIFKWPRFTYQVVPQVICDLVILTLIIHINKGAMAELGILMNAAIAGGAILTAGRTSIFFAAVASILLLFEHGIALLSPTPTTLNYAQIGFVGITFFATAILGYTLSRRIRTSEALARKRGEELAASERLNRYVVQQFHAGIILVDDEGSIQLMNDAAQQLLVCVMLDEAATIRDVSPALHKQLQTWKQTGHLPVNSLSLERSKVEVNVQFTHLGSRETTGTVVIIEDALKLSQQAQQMKLASLGRLTASIAHEIRNPLGAISHAGQLLEESHHLSDEEKRMANIICKQSERMNNLINNILHLSRRTKPKLVAIQLSSWLAEFSTDLRLQMPGDVEIDVSIADHETQVIFDSSQLAQLLTNLCQNGLRYSEQHTRRSNILLRTGCESKTGRPYIDVVDYGKLVDVNTIRQMFEPFFTTEKQGTGLGLFICKELCEANQARITFCSQEGGNYFRLLFSSPAILGTLAEEEQDE